CFNDDVQDHFVDNDLRIVLVVIDAWRISFLSDDDSPMTFLRHSITSGRAVAFTANTQSPTVTMPRIKVDNNVTRHFDSVLKSRNWDVLILHYLGLDHVGHSLGSQSPEIKKKLEEMDEIVRQVFVIVSAQSPLLLAVVGDHGMTNAGNHGGGTDAETSVPMVFLHSKANIIQRGDMKGLKSAEQVDFASTLPFFLRMPIPSGSVGLSLIPQLASQWQLSDATRFLFCFSSLLSTSPSS
ncbi:hypothetical protein OSTOST_08106, partial [Ostertagia ostertagi]